MTAKIGSSTPHAARGGNRETDSALRALGVCDSGSGPLPAIGPYLDFRRGTRLRFVRLRPDPQLIKDGQP